MTEANDPSRVSTEEIRKGGVARELPIDGTCRCADDQHLGTPCKIYNDCMLCGESEAEVDAITHSVAAKCPLTPEEIEEKKRANDKALQEKLITEERALRERWLAEEKAKRKKEIDEMIGNRMERAITIAITIAVSAARQIKYPTGGWTSDQKATLAKKTLELAEKIYDEIKAAEEAEPRKLTRGELLLMYDRVGMTADEGILWAVKNSEFFHIYPDGRPVYQERYDAVWSFNHGLAPVKRDGKQFHIRIDGTPAYEERFDNVEQFESNGRAKVSQNGQCFYIRADGSRAP